MEEYFSDKELGSKERVSEEIPATAWNGIIAVYEKYLAENYFSASFPEYCPDNNAICGFNRSLLEDRVKSEIPNIEIPLRRKETSENKITDSFQSEEFEKYVNKYATLDFIEFCHSHIKKPIQKDFHDFFGHYHLTFKDSQSARKKFRDEINQIFERNGIVFFINNEGYINRTIPDSFQELTNKKNQHFRL